MTETAQITASTGTATLWYDRDSDPRSPGWVLRYTTAAGQRNADEALDLPAGATLADALAAARSFLRREHLDA